MLAYLVANRNNVYSQGYRIFNGFSLPTLFTSTDIKNNGKRKESALSERYILFSSDVIERNGSLCRNQIVSYNPFGGPTVRCISLTNREIAIRNEVFNNVLLDRSANEYSQNPANRLCGVYKWKSVGSANVATITNLKVTGTKSFLGLVTVTTVSFLIPSLCVTIPKKRRVNGTRVNVTQADASIRFNTAWSAALFATAFELGNRNPGVAAIRSIFLANLQLSLNILNPGSSAIPGPCINGANLTIKLLS